MCNCRENRLLIGPGIRRNLNFAFFISLDKTIIDFDPMITAFLCTDAARDIFEAGGQLLEDPIVEAG